MKSCGLWENRIHTRLFKVNFVDKIKINLFLFNFIVEIAILLLRQKGDHLMDKTISEITQIWDRVLARVKDGVDFNIYSSFFAPTYVHKLENNKLYVVATSNLAKQLLSTNYLDFVQSILLEETQTQYEIEYILESEVNAKAKKVEENKQPFFSGVRVNPNCTFDNFIVGPSNKEAQQAALIVASNSGKMYNPLFIYSDSGLGKTHLLHAIGNYYKKNNPNRKVLYIPADVFVDEFVRAVRGESDDSNIKGYINSADLLLIDDVQFLANKQQTQEMFFSCYNTLYNNNKQIVITSDRYPSELKGLPDRLVSRFSSGLTVNITKPNIETCVSILKSKISASGLDTSNFDDDALQYLASQYSSNVRELEGALNSLLYYSVNIKKSQHVTFNDALDSLGGANRPSSKSDTITEATIINEVADYYRLTPSQLTGKIRISQISWARHVAMYLIREILDTPFIKIGTIFSGAHHTTVMSAVEKIDQKYRHDATVKQAIDEIKKHLGH